MEINGFEIEDFNVYNIPLKAKTSTCPLCSESRKKKTEKCMSVFWDTGLGQCNHCGEKIQLHTYKKKTNTKNYVRPQFKENPISDKVVKWFNGRGISEQTLNVAKITDGKEWMPQTKKEENVIKFNYFRDCELINVKYRDGNKNFKLVKDAEKIFYNLDGCRYADEVIIVEGEIDVLSYIEALLNKVENYNVISVPNGFNLNGSINLDYLDNCIEYFENKKRIYLAVDNDEAGNNGRKELIRRLGAERCYIVDFNDCKDANEYLIKYGKEMLLKTLILAKAVPLEGVSGVNDIGDEFEDYLLNGMNGGFEIGKPHFDKVFTTYDNQFITITGEPSSGKSDFVDEMCIGYNLNYKWKTAIASKENKPNKIHAAKIMAKLSGQWINNQDQINSDWYLNVKNYIHENFKFIDLKESYDLTSVLNKAEEMVKRYGIKILVIDPYNKIRLKESLSKSVTEYTADYLNAIEDFSMKYNVLVLLVVHPVKIMPQNGVKPEITAYHIKGGGEFFDMSPHILLVDREYEYNSVSIKVLKVKFHHLGENREKRFFKWNPNNGRFSQFSEPVKDNSELPLYNAEHDNTNWFIEKQ